MWPHQRCIERRFAAQDTIYLLCHEVIHLSTRTPGPFSNKAASQPVRPWPVLVPGFVPTQMQHFAFLCWFSWIPLTILTFVEILLVGSAIISCVIWKFVDCACCLIVQVIKKIFQWQRTQFLHPGYITSFQLDFVPLITALSKPGS